MTTRTVAIVQARMTSTRLPGKVLLDLEGQPILDWVIERARAARTLDDVVIATTRNATDDPVVAAGERLGVAVFRGDEDDVLARYREAAAAAKADVVVRLTSDCPLLDPAVIDLTVRRFREANVDYASNGLVPSFPRGLDVEVFPRVHLEACYREAVQPYERAHVTPFFYQHPERFRLLSVEAPSPHGDERWTVDTPEDLALVRELAARFAPRRDFGWEEVLARLDAEPHLREINRAIRQKELAEG
jgi:spore coat polysaccharide biosynthesis protein SpsF